MKNGVRWFFILTSLAYILAGLAGLYLFKDWGADDGGFLFNLGPIGAFGLVSFYALVLKQIGRAHV